MNRLGSIQYYYNNSTIVYQINQEVQWVVKNYRTDKEKWVGERSMERVEEWRMKKEYSLDKRQIEQFKCAIEQQFVANTSFTGGFSLINNQTCICYSIFNYLRTNEIKTVRAVCKIFREVIDSTSIGSGSILQQRFVVNLDIRQLIVINKSRLELCDNECTGHAVLCAEDTLAKFVVGRNPRLKIGLIDDASIDYLIELIIAKNACLKYIKVISFGDTISLNFDGTISLNFGDALQKVLDMIFDDKELFSGFKELSFGMLGYSLSIPAFQGLEILSFSRILENLIIANLPKLKKLQYAAVCKNAGDALLQLEPRGSSKIYFTTHEKGFKKFSDFINFQNESILGYVDTIAITGDVLLIPKFLKIIHSYQNKLTGLTRIELPPCDCLELELPRFLERIEVICPREPLVLR